MMFRSKGFTAAFCILATLIAALLVFFFYLVFGNGVENILGVASSTSETTSETASSEETTTAVTTETTTETTAETTTEETTTTEEETEAPALSASSLTLEDVHNYPVMGEEAEEAGIVTITKDGENGEGIVFRPTPEFNDPNTLGNVINHTGAFDTVQKKFFLADGYSYFLYKTFDGYYVAMDHGCLTYTAQSPASTQDLSVITNYGKNDGNGVALMVYDSDGTHILFSIYGTEDEENTGIRNAVGMYLADGKAVFEYKTEDGEIHKGTLTFADVSEGTRYKKVTITFDCEVLFSGKAVTEVELYND